MKATITIHDPQGSDDRTFVFDESSLTTRRATQSEAEAAYIIALLRGFHQRARELSDLAAESWARDARKEERLGG